MATQTITSDINVDNIASGAWTSNDTLVINNNATITVNTNQTKFWNVITINSGTLNIVNTGSTAMKFLMGRSAAASAANAITPASGLGKINIEGNWIYIGTGTTLVDTFTLPYTDFIPCLWVETGLNTHIYEPWLNITQVYGQSMTYYRNNLEGLFSFIIRL